MNSDDSTDEFPRCDGSADVPEALKNARFPQGFLFIVKALKRGGHQAFAVGGCVRDLLLGRKPKDFDVTTSARAQEDVWKLFAQSGKANAAGQEQSELPADMRGWKSSVLPTGIQHGTLLVRVRPQRGGPWFESEVTTFRGESGYADGRHPDSVVFLDDVEGDLARRDFTINAMAFDPVDSRFIDPFGGRHDLARRTIRCVGRALDRFSEDGLRPLRAVRFAAVLGFDIDAETLAAIRPTLPTFAKVSGERKRDELVKLLLAGDMGPVRGLNFLSESGLLPELLPEFAALSEDLRARALERLERLLTAAPSSPLELRLASLFCDLCPACELTGAAPKRLSATSLFQTLKRLKFSNAEIDLTMRLAAFRLFGTERFQTDAALRRALSIVTPPLADSLILLGEAQGTPPSEANALRERIERLLESHPPLSLKDLRLSGTDAARILGISPGPAVGRAMAMLLEAVIESPQLNAPDTLEQLLLSWDGQPGSQP